MKATSFILIALLVSFFSCDTDDETTDPIIGNWVLVEKSMDGTVVEFTDCLSRNRVEFYSNQTVSFKNFVTNDDTGTCDPYIIEQSWEHNKGYYRVFNASKFDQEQKISISNSQLIYSYESWEVINDDIITTDLVFTYEKQ
ncbi:lipocalin family protein [uncultured Gelidibacter sp.]|uniref:lipocalin family protein n=1 Tax=uncultured Gelidibacter sp. TaxID=259318 RepID=UPI00260EFC36|nr:lipocalin family protein [uncultured Gelidibacter sp.]